MKKVNIFYWICTGLIIAGLGTGSVLALIYPPSAESVTALGYPAYLVPFLSIARLLGIVVLVLPVDKYPVLREWAYAGISFDIVGALYSHLATGKPLLHLIGVILPLLLLAGSYTLYHRKAALTKLK